MQFFEVKVLNGQGVALKSLIVMARVNSWDAVRAVIAKHYPEWATNRFSAGLVSEAEANRLAGYFKLEIIG